MQSWRRRQRLRTASSKGHRNMHRPDIVALMYISGSPVSDV